MTNSVSARHQAKCPIFGLFAKFSDRRRQNENGYRFNCFSAEVYQDICFKRIIYHDCLLFTTRRNIHKLCIITLPSKCPIVSALVYEDCFFEQIIYHNCRLLRTRRNIDELCIFTSPGEMSDFLIAKFGGRNRRNEKGYLPVCFSAERYQNCSFQRIIYNDCLLLTTRRNIDEICIVTSARELSDCRTFRQIRRSTSSKQK